jgi:hypothetical protein
MPNKPRPKLRAKSRPGNTYPPEAAGRPLAQRLREFYGHKYGNRAPHRGGQLLLTLPGERSVYWAATDHFRIAEHLMLEAFAAALRLANVDRYAVDLNEIRGDRPTAKPSITPTWWLARASRRDLPPTTISACGLSLRNCGWRCRRLGTC